MNTIETNYLHLKSWRNSMENEKINELELVENLYVRVKNILENGRAKAFKVVNTVMIESYWNIGKEIIEEEQRGKNRAE